MTTTTSITHLTRLGGYVVVEMLQNIDLNVGQTFTLSGMSHGLNGSHSVWALPQYEYIGVGTEGDLEYDYNVPIANQVLFVHPGGDITREAATATITTNPVCTWITAEQIQAWLGFTTVSIADDAFLDQCAAAANQFCWRRRLESGYVDSLTTSPSGDVTLGTIMYGGALFRQRSSINEFASFSDMATATPTGLSPLVKQLLGISRPQVA